MPFTTPSARTMPSSATKCASSCEFTECSGSAKWYGGAGSAQERHFREEQTGCDWEHPHLTTTQRKVTRMTYAPRSCLCHAQACLEKKSLKAAPHDLLVGKCCHFSMQADACLHMHTTKAHQPSLPAPSMIQKMDVAAKRSLECQTHASWPFKLFPSFSHLLQAIHDRTCSSVYQETGLIHKER